MNTFFKTDCKQSINTGYVGSCGVYHGFSFMPEPEAMGLTGETREREFRRVEAMKLKVARTWFRPDYNQDMMKRFCLWLDKMKELNVKVALQAGWWFTKDVWFFAHENYDNEEFTRDRANFERCCDKFSIWIAKALEYFIIVKEYTNIEYLVLFTEPTSYEAGPVPDGLDDLSAYEICCRKIHERLIEYGLRDRVKLMGPNGVFTSHEDKQLAYCVEHLNDVIDIYTYHTYAWLDNGWMKNPDFIMTGYDGWKKHADFIYSLEQATGKPVWIDEYGLSGQADAFRDSSWYGNFIAQANAAFINGHLNGSFIWLLFDQKYFGDTTNNDSFYHGVHRWGTAYMPGDDVPDPENVRPSWYMISALSRYMSSGEDTVVCASEAGEGICGAVTRPENGEKISILLASLGEGEVEVDVDCAGLDDRTLTVYLYDPLHIDPQKDKLLLPPAETVRAPRFTVKLPPCGAAIITDMP